MQQGVFNPHARILHDGQYRIKKSHSVPVPIKSFDLHSLEIETAEQKIYDMHLEIERLDKQLVDMLKKSQEKENSIIERAQADAKRMMDEAEKSVFDKIQKSLQEKEELMQKTEQEAKSLIDTATREAENIRNDAKKEAENIRNDAKKEGFELGKSQGLQEGQGEIEFTVERLHNVIAETARERERILIHSESQVINLVLSMVKKVVKKLTIEHQEIVIENAKAALELLRGAMTLFIRVSPQDFNYARSFKEQLVRMIESRADLKFIEDPTIDPGGVYIETDTGDIDATIRSQLEEIENQMRFYMPVKVKTPETKKREEEKKVQKKSIIDESKPVQDIPITEFAKRTADMNSDGEIINRRFEDVVSDEHKVDESLESSKAIDSYKENTENISEDSSHDDFMV